MVMPGDKRWVGTWGAAPAPAEGVVGFNNQTIRLNPRLSIGGERLRVRISNAYGNRPLIIGAAMIALRDKGPTIVAGTGRKLSFGGRDSAVIAAGAVQYSDPVEPSHSTARRPRGQFPSARRRAGEFRDNRPVRKANQFHLASW